MATLMTLPNELLLDIASYLPTGGIHKLILTNRRVNALLKHRLCQKTTPRRVMRMVLRNKLAALHRALSKRKGRRITSIAWPPPDPASPQRHPLLHPTPSVHAAQHVPAMTTLMTLPNELLLDIASYLSTGGIHKLVLTNRRLNGLLEHRLCKNPTPCTLTTLPDDLLLHISSYLPPGHIDKLFLTNGRLNALFEPRLYQNPTPREIRLMVLRNNLAAFRRAIDYGLDVHMRFGRSIGRDEPLLFWAARQPDRSAFTNLLLNHVDITRYRLAKWPRLFGG